MDSKYDTHLASVVFNIKFFICKHFLKNNDDVAKKIEFSFEFMTVPKQEDGSGDCGIYTIKFAESIFKDKMCLKEFTAADALLMRQELAKFIRGSIKDPKIISKLPSLTF